jgi:hypothetical protein
MYALLSKKLVEESKRYQYLKTEVKQSNANGILPNLLFKLKADVLSLYLMPKTSLHIFDHTVKPILLYCSEIWGYYLPKSADFNFMFDYSRLSSVLPCAG